MQGIILVNKPQGPTSFAAVARIKRLAGQKRVGHTGTLDPMASGVLPILAGRAAALSDYLMCTDKRYTAVCRLGITTDTYDITGEVIKTAEYNVTTEQLEKVLQNYRGKIMQTPPMFSAIKRDGVKMYELARRGQAVQLEARRIEIKQLDLLEFDGTEFKIDVICSKGTYIRSLCHDIGDSLGCGAVLTSLERTMTGGFKIEDCVPLDSLTEDNIASFCKNEDIAVSHLPFVQVTKPQATRFSNGGALDVNRVRFDGEEGTILRVKYEDTLVGIGCICDGQIKIKCVINNIL